MRCRLDGVSASWGKHGVLDEITAVIPPPASDARGERQRAIPLMGTTGAGKSTLLYLIATLKKPDDGSIQWWARSSDAHGERETPISWDANGISDMPLPESWRSLDKVPAEADPPEPSSAGSETDDSESVGESGPAKASESTVDSGPTEAPAGAPVGGAGPEDISPKSRSRSQLALDLRRKYFGFAFQDSTLSGHLTVAENLQAPLIRQRLPYESVEERVDRALGQVLIGPEMDHLKALKKRFPHQLSGGQRQRIALAQALIHDPRVLFADEPAGNLDLATRRQVMDVLRQWLDQGGAEESRLLIWVTHHADDPKIMGASQVLWVGDGTAEYRSTTEIEGEAAKLLGVASR